MPAMLGVAAERAKGRAARIRAVELLLILDTPHVWDAERYAALLLDMPDADWRELVHLRRIEAKIRRDATRAIARTPQIVAARKARRVAQCARHGA